MKIKVCGMKRNITEVAGLHPAYLGFIFWEGSPRYFEGEMPVMGDNPKKVGVFVNASYGTILEITARYGLHMIQLHGNETPEFCKALRKLLHPRGENIRNTKITKVFSVRDSFDFSVLQSYEQVCDYFLFDTKGLLPGGNGYTFDWTLLSNYPSNTPFFLSGGIGPGELDQIRAFLQRPEAKFCHAIDVNSRFEQQPGFKNTETLEPFIREIQSAGHKSTKNHL
jgi:phosphoribosylanthranilate isomerase